MKPAENTPHHWSEDKLQIKVFVWFNNTFPELRGQLFHVPNGGRRTGMEAKKFKVMGVVPGVADLLGFIGKPFALELKRPDGRNGQGKEQKKWEKVWTGLGYEYYIMNDEKEIKDFLTKRIEEVSK